MVLRAVFYIILRITVLEVRQLPPVYRWQNWGSKSLHELFIVTDPHQNMVVGLVVHNKAIYYYIMLLIYNRARFLGIVPTFDIKSRSTYLIFKPRENRNECFCHSSKERITPAFIYCKQSNGCCRIGEVEIYTNSSGCLGACN